MHISDILKPGTTPVSFEFFPPRNPEGETKLLQTLAELQTLCPAYASVTYGAGGSTRELTRAWVRRVQEHRFPAVVPHLTCVGHREDDIHELLEQYAASGVDNILALRGDRPRGADGRGLAPGDPENEAFDHAADLVRYIRNFRGKSFGIGVAGFPEGHPGTPNRLLELDYLKAKVDAGADYICTQFFFDNRDFFDFRDRCDLAGIRIPIVAGILPLPGSRGLKRLAELAGGARFPAELLRKLQEAGGDEDKERRVGIDHATEQIRDLIQQQAAGIHLYTLNQADAVRAILEKYHKNKSARTEPRPRG